VTSADVRLASALIVKISGTKSTQRSVLDVELFYCVDSLLRLKERLTAEEAILYLFNQPEYPCFDAARARQ